MIRVLLAFALLAFPAAVAAQQEAATPPPPAATEAAPAGNDDEPEPEIVVQEERAKKVCETRRDTGSIIPKRICRTPEQVEAEQEEAQATLDLLSAQRDTANWIAESRGAGK